MPISPELSQYLNEEKSTVVVPTKNRPQTVGRLLGKVGENLGDYDRRQEWSVTVLETGESQETVDRIKAEAIKVCQETGAQIVMLTLNELKTLLEELTEGEKYSLEQLQSAFLDHGVGGIRSLVNLLCLGRQFITLDDDMAPQMRTMDGLKQEDEHSSEVISRGVYLPKKQLLARTQIVPIDLVEVCGGFLGKRLSETNLPLGVVSGSRDAVLTDLILHPWKKNDDLTKFIIPPVVKALDPMIKWQSPLEVTYLADTHAGVSVEWLLKELNSGQFKVEDWAPYYYAVSFAPGFEGLVSVRWKASTTANSGFDNTDLQKPLPPFFCSSRGADAAYRYYLSRSFPVCLTAAGVDHLRTDEGRLGRISALWIKEKMGAKFSKWMAKLMGKGIVVVKDGWVSLDYEATKGLDYHNFTRALIPKTYAEEAFLGGYGKEIGFQEAALGIKQALIEMEETGLTETPEYDFVNMVFEPMAPMLNFATAQEFADRSGWNRTFYKMFTNTLFLIKIWSSLNEKILKLKK